MKRRMFGGLSKSWPQIRQAWHHLYPTDTASKRPPSGLGTPPMAPPPSGLGTASKRPRHCPCGTRRPCHHGFSGRGTCPDNGRGTTFRRTRSTTEGTTLNSPRHHLQTVLVPSICQQIMHNKRLVVYTMSSASALLSTACAEFLRKCLQPHLHAALPCVPSLTKALAEGAPIAPRCP